MIITELKNLKDIKPQQDWVQSEREILLSQIIGQRAESKPQSFFATAKNFSKIFLPNKMLKFVAQPVGVMVMVFAAVFSTGILGVNASKGSVPGDILYSVKKTSEKVKVGLTSQMEEKAKLHVGFAAERVKEVEKIVKQENNKESKKEKVKIATDGLKEELTKAKEQMEQAKENPTDAKAVVEAAKDVDKKAEELSVQINEKKDDLAKAVSEEGDQEVLQTLDAAAIQASVTSIKAVEVIVEKHQDGTVKQTESELIDVIGSKISKVEVKIQDAKDQMTKMEADIKTQADANPVDPANPPTVAQIAVTDATKSAIVEAKTKPIEATQILTEAKDLLSQGDLTTALEKVIQSTEMTSQAVVAVQALPSTTPTTTVQSATPAVPVAPVPATTAPTTAPTTTPITNTVPSATPASASSPTQPATVVPSTMTTVKY